MSFSGVKETKEKRLDPSVRIPRSTPGSHPKRPQSWASLAGGFKLLVAQGGFWSEQLRPGRVEAVDLILHQGDEGRDN